MSDQSMKKYYPTAFALYFSYFILGISLSILSQYKQEFAGLWGAVKLADGSYDVSGVLAVIAAFGLGRLISLPFAGPLSDKFGRRISGLIGCGLFIVFFVGIVLAPNMVIAYAMGIVAGMANSFLDTAVTPSCMEIFVKNGAIANLFTKFSISVAQFLLPFMIGWVAAASLSFRTIFFVAAVGIALDAVALAILPFPPRNQNAVEKEGSTAKQKMKFTASSIALICLGFTTTSTFQLWLNCNQELGKMVGMADPSKIQSAYSLGIIAAILLTSVLLKKWLKPVRVLILYPIIALLTILAVYFIQTPWICMIGGFLLGYSAAGGVLQLVCSTANEMFPTNKGKITSIVMIASSIANYVILNIAGLLTKVGGIDGPKYVLLLNAGVTILGILLALYVNKEYEKNKSPENQMV